MNRKKFIGLIFMMLFSIVGITCVQIVWISKAVGVLNKNFNASVIASINDAARTIESSARMNNFFNDFLLEDPFKYNRLSDTASGYLNIESFSLDDGGNVSITSTIQSISGKPGEAPVITTHDTTFTSDSVTLIITSPDDAGKMKIIQKGKETVNDGGAVYIRQQELIDYIRKRSYELQNFGDQIISEIYQSERAMDPDSREIEFALRQSLLYSDIRIPFEFALIKNGEVQEGTFKKSGKNDFLRSNYKVRLFPDNIIRQNLVLSVVFPGRTNYVLGSMSWILGGSLLFSLIILATFAMSLFFIIRQKKISEMKSDFLNNMTHEFKTPIATISLAADTITNPKVINDESSIRHFISMIKKENNRMNKKVETILQIASLDKKEINFKFENVSLHNVIERAVDTIDIQVQQKNGSVRLNLQASEPVVVGDVEHLTNLVNNLLDNAIKYSRESPMITIETKNNEKGIVLSVEDRGVGMSKSIQSKIFDRFYRQSTGNVHDVKGFGLGLNYVRAIVDAHRGTISVTSEPGKGSRFTVFIPFNLENESPVNNKHKRYD